MALYTAQARLVTILTSQLEQQQRDGYTAVLSHFWAGALLSHISHEARAFTRRTCSLLPASETIFTVHPWLGCDTRLCWSPTTGPCFLLGPRAPEADRSTNAATPVGSPLTAASSRLTGGWCARRCPSQALAAPPGASAPAALVMPYIRQIICTPLKVRPFVSLGSFSEPLLC